MSRVCPETTRSELADLPADTSFGTTPTLRDVYLPRSHLKALHPDNPLVTGMRGAGKTFWWRALQDPQVRALVAKHAERPRPTGATVSDRNTVVRAGFGDRPAPEQYPNKEAVLRLMNAGVHPRAIWRTVQAWQLLPHGEDDHPLRRHTSWEARVDYVAENPEATERLFQERDDEFASKGTCFLILFDALDRCADDWKDMNRAIVGLLQATRELRSYRWLRAKVFLRSDLIDESTGAELLDVSKVFSAPVELTWPRHELYGLVWHHLGNREGGSVFRRLFGGDQWTSTIIDGHELYEAPRRLIADESHQRERFGAVAGPAMGSDRRHGMAYTWIANHLADAKGRASPRSFLAALRAAAVDTASRKPEHGYALHHESVRRGVLHGSTTRLGELLEDYPWLHTVLGSLKGMVVPCAFDEIAEQWRRERVLERLTDAAGEDDVKLPPRHLDRGADGIREDLESLGIFHRMRDDRVNIPDVFRVGVGLGRRGGVKPISRTVRR